MPRSSPSGEPSPEWVIKEGISFVQGFDRDHAALITGVTFGEAKRFGSHLEAELWVSRFGEDLASYSIVSIERHSGVAD